MARYFLKRILTCIVVFFGITFFTYILADLAPGDPTQMFITETMTDEQVEELRVRMGQDRPVVVRYVNWLTTMLNGNFGRSYSSGLLISKQLPDRVMTTLKLSIPALFISILIAIPFGVMAAKNPYSFYDYCCSGIAFLGVALPDFFVALILLLLFSVKLRWLPGSGESIPGDASLWGSIKCMSMPVSVLAFSQVGSLMRQTRSAMLEVLNSDYVKMARAKGISGRRVTWHALRNALIPIVTQIGNTIPFLIAGSVVIEQIFGWPGMGKWMISAIQARDYPVIMALTVLISIGVLGCNVLIDVLYSLLDPRITYDTSVH